MSKIQDAIRKLQSTAQADRKTASQPRNTTRPIAEVVHTEHNNGNRESTKSSVVTVDYEQLRDAGLLAPVEQQRHIADQYRLIKRPILDNAAGRGTYTAEDRSLVMIASPLSGDGKTFTCINLALSMATEKDTSVLLVDADVAKPHISQLFGIENEPGLIDALVDGNTDVGGLVFPTNVSGLSLLAAGSQNEHATELLASRRMGALVGSLSKSYPDTVVIFDSPPLLATSEARVLASLMGQIVIVVSSGYTPQHAVQDAIESLDPEKAISLLLNQSSNGFGADGYGGYGGYRYGSR